MVKNTLNNDNPFPLLYYEAAINCGPQFERLLTINLLVGSFFKDSAKVIASGVPLFPTANKLARDRYGFDFYVKAASAPINTIDPSFFDEAPNCIVEYKEHMDYLTQIDNLKDAIDHWQTTNHITPRERWMDLLIILNQLA